MPSTSGGLWIHRQCVKKEEPNLHQSGLPFRQISALLLLRPLIFILCLVSVLSLCWGISPFSWVIQRHRGLPQRTPTAQLIVLSCTAHMPRQSTHTSAVSTCTLHGWYLVKHPHTSVTCHWKARIFLPSLFDPTSYPSPRKTARQRFPPSSSFSSAS